MHEDVEKLVNAGRISEAVGQKLSTLAPGKYVLHSSWGSGKVSAWDLFGGKVTIDFEGSKDQVMGLKLALQKLAPLEEGDLRIERLEDLEGLKAAAQEAPDEIVVRLLQVSGGRLSPDQIENELSGSLIDADLYKKWWDKAKKKLRESKRANVPTKRTEYLTLRDENVKHIESLLSDFQEAKTIKAKIKVLDAIKSEDQALVEDPVILQKIVTEIDGIATNSLKMQGGATLELLCYRDELASLVEGYNIPEDAYTLTKALQRFSGDLATATSPLASVRQRRIYEAFPEAFGDEWLKKILTIFNTIGTRGVGEIAKLLEEHEHTKDLHKHVKKALSLRTLGPDTLSWICRERNKSAKKSFSYDVGLAILNTIESDYLDDGPRSSNRLQAYVMEDRDLITDFLKGVEPNDIQNFSKKLLSSPAFPDLDRKSLMARIIKAYPNMGELVEGTVTKRDTSLIVSWTSLERKKEEYRDLIETRIPQNIKDIAIARSYGDLRENFEYKAAKDMQLVLNRRKGEVEQELNRAKGTDFENPDTDKVSIGTVISLDGDNGAETYTILGAWDGDPDQNILSYKSVVAKGLIGKKVGDEVSIQNYETEEFSSFTIKEIAPYNKG